MALFTEQAPFGIPTVRACQPIRMEVAFQAEDADAVVQQLSDRKVNHVGIIPLQHGGYTRAEVIGIVLAHSSR